MIEECLAVEFDVSGDDCPLAQATDQTDVIVECDPPQLRDDGNVLLHFTAPPSDAFAEILDADDRIRYLHRSRGDGRDTYRCLSKHPCIVHELTNAGFMAETLTYRDGEERHTGAVVGNEVLQGVMAAAGDAVGVRLRRVYPVGPESPSAQGRWDLTPAQADAIRTAWAMGYFAVPKEATAAAVAAELDISKTAFLERLRRGQAGLFGQLFE
jgi:predicted DNA binding protein